MNENLESAQAGRPITPLKPSEEDDHGRAADEIRPPDHPLEAETVDRGEGAGDDSLGPDVEFHPISASPLLDGADRPTEMEAGGFDPGEHERSTIRSIALGEIRIDERVQARAEMVAETEYAIAMLAGDKFPPLTVFQEGDTYILADGFTRHAAAKCVGRTEFDCEIRAGGLREAILFAAGANATHGRPRSNDDKRCAAFKLLNDVEWRNWSNREIARHCHVSHQLVAQLRRVTGPATSGRKYRTKHGTVSEMATGNIGTKSRCKPGKTALQSHPLESTPGRNETATAPGIPAIVETTSAAVSKVTDVGSEGGIHADQHVGPDEALGILAEFTKFMIAHIANQGETIVLTVTADEVPEFKRLADRVRFVINHQEA